MIVLLVVTAFAAGALLAGLALDGAICERRLPALATAGVGLFMILLAGGAAAGAWALAVIAT